MLVSNRRLKLLLVEDNQFFALVIQQLLHDQGHSCTVAPLMEKAFELCRSENFDLCISDYNLPDSHGAVSIRQLKKLASAPLLLISGNQDIADLPSLKQDNSVDLFILKPFVKELFIESINTLVL